jgi:hypothetical protein
MRILTVAARLALGLAAVAGAPAGLPGQVMTKDEGSFTITRGGANVGREEFSIRSTPAASGEIVVARANISLDEARLLPALSTDEAGAPSRYQIEIKSGTKTIQLLKGQLSRGRFSVQLQTPRGESAREFVASRNALILDDDVFHQYYFLARMGRAGDFPVVVPRRNVQVTVHVEDRGTDQLTIGGRVLDGHHLMLTEPGRPTRDIWVDALFRVLKVAIESEKLIAMRDDPPR